MVLYTYMYKFVMCLLFFRLDISLHRQIQVAAVTMNHLLVQILRQMLHSQDNTRLDSMDTAQTVICSSPVSPWTLPRVLWAFAQMDAAITALFRRCTSCVRFISRSFSSQKFRDARVASATLSRHSNLPVVESAARTSAGTENCSAISVPLSWYTLMTECIQSRRLVL